MKTPTMGHFNRSLGNVAFLPLVSQTFLGSLFLYVYFTGFHTSLYVCNLFTSSPILPCQITSFLDRGRHILNPYVSLWLPLHQPSPLALFIRIYNPRVPSTGQPHIQELFYLLFTSFYDFLGSQAASGRRACG
jgi:hypothetical protein